MRRNIYRDSQGYYSYHKAALYIEIDKDIIRIIEQHYI